MLTHICRRSVLVGLAMPYLATPAEARPPFRLRNDPQQLLSPPILDEKGTTWYLDDFAGRVILLNIWATWCPPCNEEMPELVAIAKEYEARGVVFIADLAQFGKLQQMNLAFALDRLEKNNAMLVCGTTKPVTALADAIGHDPRIGRRFLNAGLGFGGGCLPKDIRAFAARADDLGVGSVLGLLREVDEINMRRRDALVALVERACDGSVLGRNIAVLGAAFKPESDDVRDSPALAVAARLSLSGARVSVFDPKAMHNAARAFPTLRYAESAAAAARGAAVVVVATEWAEFVHMPPVELSDLVARRLIVDARRCLDGTAWADAGWDYRVLGSQSVPGPYIRTGAAFGRDKTDATAQNRAGIASLLA